MKLLGRNRLQPMYGLDDQTDTWLRNWVTEMSNANWKHPKDVFRQFPQVKSSNTGIFYFRAGVRAQYIEVSMMFPLAIAIVTDLKPVN
jgi:hypothetical protein